LGPFILGNERSWVRKVCNSPRNNYIGSIIDTAFRDNDTKPFWRFIKSQRNDCLGIAPLKSGDHLVADASSKAEILNHRFKSVFSKEDTTTAPTLSGPRFPSISNITIDSYGVGKLLSNLSANKASGPDNIPCTVLKGLAYEISPVLTDIFQLSITTGTSVVTVSKCFLSVGFGRFLQKKTSVFGSI